MIIDSSAIIAVLFKEPGYETILDRMKTDEFLGIGCPTLAETGIVLNSKLGASARVLLSGFLKEFGIMELPFGEDHWREAVIAYEKYGKGRNPAKLNFGDCMSYAIAKVSGQSLLFAGRDFNSTDIVTDDK
jgi:ribonuclease VapC